MIKRPTLLKILKQHGKYEKKFFTMKKQDIEDEMRKMGISIVAPSEDNAKPKVAKPKVVKKKVKIIEPDSDSSDTDSESESESESVQTPVIIEQVKPTVKLARRSKNTTPQLDERTNIRNEQKDRESTIRLYIKDFTTDIRNLLSQYDDGEIDKFDEQNIIDTFDTLDDQLRDKLENIIDHGSFTDSMIRKIEKQLETQEKKVEKFLYN
jgi:signal transduction protein with GAF and PtsI domain